MEQLIAKNAGTPTSKVYTILARLVAKSMIQVDESAPEAYPHTLKVSGADRNDA